jgi:hypothetical protein
MVRYSPLTMVPTVVSRMRGPQHHAGGGGLPPTWLVPGDASQRSGGERKAPDWMRFVGRASFGEALGDARDATSTITPDPVSRTPAPSRDVDQAAVTLRAGPG